MMRLGCWMSVVWLVGVGTGLFARADDELNAELQQRRARIMQKMGGEGMLLLLSAKAKHKTGDVNYEFRQENNILYLTGIGQEGIALVLMPENSKFREILFLPKRNPAREIWTGRTLSREEAGRISGIKQVWNRDELEPFLDRVLDGGRYRTGRNSSTSEYKAFSQAVAENRAKVFMLLGEKPGLKGTPSGEFQFAMKLRERFFGIRMADASPFFNSMRMVKSPYELQQIRRAIAITCQAHREAMRTVAPDMWEYEIEAVIEAAFKRQNAFDWAYPSIIGSGPNSTTLHYDKSSRRMLDGEMILMDVGAEYHYYAADVTRSVPVNGHFSAPQRDIYELVFEAQAEALKIIQPGTTLPDIHRRAVEVIRDGLLRLGLITDRSGSQYRMFFMHGSSHHLGMDVHDVGDRSATLEPGMVFTVEPGIYIREDVLDHLPPTDENRKLIASIRGAVEKYQNIGVRIEDDVLVTPTGYELLSAAAPRTIEEIEKLMRP